MKKITLSAAILATVASSLTLSSCIGSFSLTRQVIDWNKQVGSKFINEVVFFALWIVPVYEVTFLCDVLVINSIEFWSGSNPLTASTKIIDSEQGRYLIACDDHGYTVTFEPTGQSVRLDFADDTWSIVTENGGTYELMTFLDSSHVRVPAPDGTRRVVSLDNEGLMAYRAEVSQAMLMAAR
ncbi:MAG: DUF3332 domain-containing protein [Muribaculaceae bacterium]|nr:DUF3332 domain-containing protein [Muribaculaceae bacterium]